MSSIDQRYHQLCGWLEVQLGPELRVEVASVDASFRRYFRVHRGLEHWIAMDAPPPREDAGGFVRVQELFQQLGLNVPQIIAADLENGFLLLTDFGDQHYLQALNDDSVAALYRDALAALRHLQQPSAALIQGLPEYDEALLRQELAIFKDWYVERHRGIQLPPEVWQPLTDLLVQNALAQPRVVVHRDYHSRNLMVLAQGNPGVLDFQDAVWGPVTYDLVSLLRDCYIAWPDDQVRAWCLDYRRHLLGTPLAGPDEAGFLRWFDLMGMQRHLKAVGIFARLNHRDGRPGYLADIPRTLGYVRAVAERYPECAGFIAWLDRDVLS